MRAIKNISIKMFLAGRGVHPQQEHVGYGMYLSPLRTERTPSFKVDYNKNLWYDFGSGEGGSIIDLVMKLDNCSLSDAISKLENGQTFSFHRVELVGQPIEPSTEITEIRELNNLRLLEYLRKRAVRTDIAHHYCKEVHYSNNGKSYYAVGFSNDSGGWELRNEYFQGSVAPKVPTIVKGSADSTLLFEGFMDMLSYLTLLKSVETVSNICVLNSVNNLHKAEPFLKTQKTIHCFLDNDTAGQKALSVVQSWGIEIVDHSNLYKDFNDLNDYLKSKSQAQNPPQRGAKMKF